MRHDEQKDAEKSDLVAQAAAKALDLEHVEENPQLDKRLNRKFDLHILPWLFGIW